MTLNLPLLYVLWLEEYCQISPNEKKKSPNLWHVASILVCCIFASIHLKIKIDLLLNKRISQFCNLSSETTQASLLYCLSPLLYSYSPILAHPQQLCIVAPGEKWQFQPQIWILIANLASNCGPFLKNKNAGFLIIQKKFLHFGFILEILRRSH